MNNKHLMSKVTKTSSWITDGLSQKDIDEALEEARKQIEEVKRKRETENEEEKERNRE